MERIGIFCKAVIAPTSKDDNTRRKEFILNIITLTSIFLLVILDATIVFNEIRLGFRYHGVPLTLFLFITISYVFLFILSKKGHSSVASYILIITYVFGALYTGWHWGISLPATLLAFTLITVTSSILIDSTFGYISSTILVVLLSLLGIHEAQSLGVQSWKYEVITPVDVIVYSTILGTLKFQLPAIY